MRSLPIAVLFSMVSLVAALSNNGHTHRHTHARGCKTKTGGTRSQTSGMQKPTGGMMNQTDVKQNQTVAYGKQNQTVSNGKQNQTATIGKHNQTVSNGSQNQTVTNGSPYQLVDQYVGADFLNETKWSAFTHRDFTNGLVQYVSHDTARGEGMTSLLPNGAATLSVDNKTDLPLNTPRKSMRITTTQKYNGGLFIADFARMPFGCSLWPAYWSYGTDKWPINGEVDILEGVNNQVTNQMTLHTGPQCFLDENPTSGNASTPPFSGNVLNTACASSAGDNTGCAFRDSDHSSYGPGFNQAGGGIFAHLWNRDGIKIWHFKRSSIPQDIISGRPDPSTWRTPVAFWSNSDCDMASHFIDHSLVIDTTLCGDWAGNSNVYANSGCAGTCAEAVSKASNFENAYWEVNSIKVYTTG